MPYPRTLHRYTLPEFYAEAPREWEQRLREISPVRDDMDHLVFRKFDFHPSWERGRPSEWTWEPRPIWALYTAVPAHLVDKDLAECYRVHWSDMPTEGEQIARRETVSNYQHFMWHTRGLRVQPFWLLQGNGGTPAHYSERERGYLRGAGAETAPIPLGYLPACPFDERAVGMILERDRMVKAGNRLDQLERMNRSEYLRWEMEDGERSYREQWLKTIRDLNAPSVDFMKFYLKKSEAAMTLPDAPEGLANTLAQWRETFLETGQMLGVRAANVRSVSVAVA